MNPKLFVVEMVESGWGWSKTAWKKYFMAHSIETVKAVLKERYGELDQYHFPQ